MGLSERIAVEVALATSGTGDLTRMTGEVRKGDAAIKDLGKSADAAGKSQLSLGAAALKSGEDAKKFALGSFQAKQRADELGAAAAAASGDLREKLSRAAEKASEESRNLAQDADRAAKRTAELGAAARLGDADMTKAGRAAQRMGRDAEAMSRQLGAAGDSAREMAGKVDASGKEVGSAFSRMGPMLKAGLAGIGAAGAAALMQGFTSNIQKEAAGAKFAAQFGDFGPESKKLGAIGGRLYADAYGSNLGDIHQALSAVTKSGLAMTDETEEGLQRLTGRAMSLATAFDQDVVQTIRAAGQMVRTGLAKNGEEALDILTRTFQVTGDLAGDTAETFSEYGTEFRSLGLSGAEAAGMMAQAVAGGARDIDTAADALKEFAIRSKDNSETTREAFKDIGLNADVMLKKFSEGGPAAREALQQVFDKLGAIEDPARRSKDQVALFGTKAEDLQGALDRMNPEKAVATLGTIEGAAKKVDEQLAHTTETTLEKYKRGFELKFGEAAGIAQTKTEGLGANLESFWDRHGATVKGKVGSMWDGVVGITGNKLEFVAGVLGGGVRILDGIWTASNAAIEGKWGLAWDGVKRIWQGAESIIRPAFANFAGFLVNTFFGAAGRLVDAAAFAFGWIPGIGPKVKDAQDKFWGFAREVNAAVQQGINPSKEISITLGTYLDEGSMHRRSGRQKYAAAGGFITGPGGPKDDAIPAWLSSGEYVVNAAAVSRLGVDTLDWMNAQGYARGGVVPKAIKGPMPNVPAINRQLDAILAANRTSILGALGGGVLGAAAPKGAIQQYAMMLLNARGWGGQWGAFNALVMGESGWNPRATNPSSGAYGIPQSLPASKLDTHGNRHDPAVQLRWMLDYIGGRYGNPNNAYAAWLARRPHWYAKGGLVGAAGRRYAGGGFVSGGGNVVRWGDVSGDEWDRLMAAGWWGDPADNMDALYRPHTRNSVAYYDPASGRTLGYMDLMSRFAGPTLAPSVATESWGWRDSELDAVKRPNFTPISQRTGGYVPRISLRGGSTDNRSSSVTVNVYASQVDGSDIVSKIRQYARWNGWNWVGT